MTYLELLNKFYEFIFNKTDFKANPDLNKIESIKATYGLYIDNALDEFIEYSFNPVDVKKAISSLIYVFSEIEKAGKYGILAISLKDAEMLYGSYFLEDERFKVFAIGSDEDKIKALEDDYINILFGIAYILQGFTFNNELIFPTLRVFKKELSNYFKVILDLFNKRFIKQAINYYEKLSHDDKDVVFKIFNRNDGLFFKF